MTNSNEQDKEWDLLAEAWQSDQSVGKVEGVNQLNQLVEQVRVKERKSSFALGIDLVVASVFLIWGIWETIEFLSRASLFSDLSNLEAGRTNMDGKVISTMGVLLFYGINFLFCLGLLLLGSYIGYRSVVIHQRSWQRKFLASANPQKWFAAYYDDQINLCSIGKRVGIGFALFFWLMFILGAFINPNAPLSHFEDIHRLVAVLGLLVVLPATIYFAARWREKKWHQEKNAFLENC